MIVSFIVSQLLQTIQLYKYFYPRVGQQLLLSNEICLQLNSVNFYFIKKKKYTNDKKMLYFLKYFPE